MTPLTYRQSQVMLLLTSSAQRRARIAEQYQRTYGAPISDGHLNNLLTSLRVIGLVTDDVKTEYALTDMGTYYLHEAQDTVTHPRRCA